MPYFSLSAGFRRSVGHGHHSTTEEKWGVPQEDDSRACPERAAQLCQLRDLLQSVKASSAPSTPPTSLGAARKALCAHSLPVREGSRLRNRYTYVWGFFFPLSVFDSVPTEESWRQTPGKNSCSPAAPDYLTRRHR